MDRVVISDDSLCELKEDLAIVGEKLNSISHKIAMLEKFNSNPSIPFPIIPDRLIDIAKTKEKKLTEEYLCLEHLISEIDDTRFDHAVAV